MNDLKGSDRAIVAEKPANKGRFRSLELVEPRVRPEGNPVCQVRDRAQKRASLSQAADRMRYRARPDLCGGRRATDGPAATHDAESVEWVARGSSFWTSQGTHGRDKFRG